MGYPCCKLIDEENRFYIRDFDKYNLEVVKEEDGVIYYKKEITTVDDLKSIPYYVDNKGLKMKLEFRKR